MREVNSMKSKVLLIGLFVCVMVMFGQSPFDITLFNYDPNKNNSSAIDDNFSLGLNVGKANYKVYDIFGDYLGFGSVAYDLLEKNVSSGGGLSYFNKKDLLGTIQYGIRKNIFKYEFLFMVGPSFPQNWGGFSLYRFDIPGVLLEAKNKKHKFRFLMANRELDGGTKRNFLGGDYRINLKELFNKKLSIIGEVNVINHHLNYVNNTNGENSFLGSYNIDDYFEGDTILLSRTLVGGVLDGAAFGLNLKVASYMNYGISTYFTNDVNTNLSAISTGKMSSAIYTVLSGSHKWLKIGSLYIDDLDGSFKISYFLVGNNFDTSKLRANDSDPRGDLYYNTSTAKLMQMKTDKNLNGIPDYRDLFVNVNNEYDFYGTVIDDVDHNMIYDPIEVTGKSVYLDRLKVGEKGVRGYVQGKLIGPLFLKVGGASVSDMLSKATDKSLYGQLFIKNKIVSLYQTFQKVQDMITNDLLAGSYKEVDDGIVSELGGVVKDKMLFVDSLDSETKLYLNLNGKKLFSSGEGISFRVLKQNDLKITHIIAHAVGKIMVDYNPWKYGHVMPAIYSEGNYYTKVVSGVYTVPVANNRSDLILKLKQGLGTDDDYFQSGVVFSRRMFLNNKTLDTKIFQLQNEFVLRGPNKSGYAANIPITAVVYHSIKFEQKIIDSSDWEKSVSFGAQVIIKW